MLLLVLVEHCERCQKHWCCVVLISKTKGQNPASHSTSLNCSPIAVSEPLAFVGGSFVASTVYTCFETSVHIMCPTFSQDNTPSPESNNAVHFVSVMKEVAVGAWTVGMCCPRRKWNQESAAQKGFPSVAVLDDGGRCRSTAVTEVDTSSSTTTSRKTKTFASSSSHVHEET